MKNTFYVSCPIDTYSGYGARSRDFVKALIKSEKYDVKIVPQRWGTTRKGFIEDNPEWKFLQKHITPSPQQKPDIWCQITVPNEFQPIGKFNIGLTAGIETTVCAPQWVEGCNRMDLILTSSNHSKKVFESTVFEIQNQQTNQQTSLGLNTPIEVLMEGANLDVYKTVKKYSNTELYNYIDGIKENFCYLFVGHWLQGDIGEDRKNLGLLVKAFYEVFKNKGNAPALILKTSLGKGSHIDRREVLHRINQIKKSVPADKLPNIYVVHGELSNSDINELYNHPKVKSMINLTKGEGFGRPLLEFSLIGKPIITTGWSGHTDFLNPNLTAMVAGKLQKVHSSAIVKDIILPEAEWFSPDHGQIGYFMTDVKKNYKAWLVKGKKQGAKNRKEFSFEKMCLQLDNILTEHLPSIPTTMQLELPKLELPKLQKV